MLLYDAPAPNPRRVRIFLHEKGIDIPKTVVPIMNGGTRTPEFLAKNSLGETPILELDDGRILTESVAICRYFEALHPNPPLFGVGPEGLAFTEMWTRRVEIQLMATIGDVALHTFQFFADKIDQNADYAASQKRVMAEKWAWLDNEMRDGRPFVGGDDFTVADITGMAVLMIADFAKIPIPGGLSHVEAWADRLKARPSWSA